jgi:hypothetical protein
MHRRNVTRNGMGHLGRVMRELGGGRSRLLHAMYQRSNDKIANMKKTQVPDRYKREQMELPFEEEERDV